MLSLNAPWSDQLKRWARLRLVAEIEEEIDKAVKETGRRSVFLDEIYERLDRGAQMRFYDAVGNPSSITIADNNELLSVFCTRHEADYSFGTTVGVKDNALPPEGLGELARFVFKDAKRIRGNIVLFDDVVATGRFESQDRSALRKRFKELRKQHPGLFELSCGCVVVHG